LIGNTSNSADGTNGTNGKGGDSGDPPSHHPAWCSQDGNVFGDEDYLLAGARYVELNPVRAKLVERAEDYAWSSARAHLDGKDDILVKTAPMLERVECIYFA